MPALTTVPTIRRLRGIAVLVAVAAMVAACGAASVPSATAPPASAEPPTPVIGGPGGLLVTYRAHGGHCRTGTCEFVAEIHADGRVSRSDGMAQEVDPMSLGLLTEAIEAADWEAILAVPFQGECPVNVDGQEQVYTFHVEPEPVVVASCTTQVDPSQEPFRTVDGILFGTGG